MVYYTTRDVIDQLNSLKERGMLKHLLNEAFWLDKRNWTGYGMQVDREEVRRWFRRNLPEAKL
ncbi:MAG: hypothetical protein V2G41_09535 [bacterium JZ-2024 1]